MANNMAHALKNGLGYLQVGEVVVGSVSIKGGEYVFTDHGQFFEVLATRPATGQDKKRGGITLRPAEITIDDDPDAKRDGGGG